MARNPYGTDRQNSPEGGSSGQANFDECLHRLRCEIPTGSFVYLWKKQGTQEEPKHKLVVLVTGPYEVIEVTDDIFVIARSEERERVSRDRVELAPSPIHFVIKNRLSGASNSLQRKRKGSKVA